MNFFFLIVCLITFIIVNAVSPYNECMSKIDEKIFVRGILRYGYVCAKCDLNVHLYCRNGPYSKVLEWETDIFEVGFTELDGDRPKEIVIRIDLNKDYYTEIKIISDKKKRTVNVKLNECSHTRKSCSENRNFVYRKLGHMDYTFVAIGFRKDKKMNFEVRNNWQKYATDHFGRDSEYEFKMPGFYFNTNETMKITISSKYDKKFYRDGFRMILPTSAGGFFFNEFGFLTNENDKECKSDYTNPNENKGLPYIIREYYNNSENWKAPPVKDTKYQTVPYFDENGMKVGRDQMLVKEGQNPDFDAKKMIRKGCKFVEKPNTDTEPDFTETTTTELTLTEEETTEATTTTLTEEETTEATTTTLTEEETTEATKPDDLKKKSLSTPMPPPTENKNQFKVTLPLPLPFPSPRDSLPEGEIRINQTVLIPKLYPSEKSIDLKDLFELAGNKSFDQNYFNNVGKGGEDLKNVILRNGTPVDLTGYKFKDPDGKKKKKGTSDTKKQTKPIGGSGGAGGKGQEAQEA
ncbi:UNVERIFIED_CONTAM: hypothetical protein RMT77_014686 [Armadillidium vulgare]